MADKADRLPKEGEIVAKKYEVNEILGRGGMGLVVAATHLQLEQRVAIKFLTEEADKDTKQRFNREARAAAKLKSEHVARVHDVGELDDGTPYMVMEYLSGADLGKVSKQRGALPIAEALGYVLQACEAIAEAHAVGIVHRDLKPPNLFLAHNPDGTVTLKVLDFGISKDRTVESLSRTEEDLTKTSMVLGTPHFMAPEQMRSAKDVDARADIWSLGAILYQLLTGKRPFRGPTFPELVVRVIQEDPIAPSALRPELPEEISNVILKCLSKEAEDRFPNVADLCFAIAPYGPPQSFARAERMERMLGLAPLSTAPGSAPPPSMTAPGVSSRRPSSRGPFSGRRSRPPNSRSPNSQPMSGRGSERGFGGRSSRPPSSRKGPSSVSASWYPDTEQEFGDPTQQDGAAGPSSRGGPPVSGRTANSAAESVDVVGLSAFDKTAIADPALFESAGSDDDGDVPSTQMTAETRVPIDTALREGRRRKGPSLRILGVVAGASVALLVAVAVLKPPANEGAPAVQPPAQPTGASPPGTAEPAVSAGARGDDDTPPAASASASVRSSPQGRPSPTPKPDEPPTAEPEEQPEPTPEPAPEPTPAPTPVPPVAPKTTPKPAPPPPPRPPPPRPPPPKPQPPKPVPKSNPLDMEIK